jgi:hypothetical protein
MQLKPLLSNYIPERILHRHAVSFNHTVCVNVDNVNVIKRLDEVGTRDDLASFVKWDLGKVKLLCSKGSGFAVDKSTREDDCCSLGRVSLYMGTEKDL